MVLLRYRVLNAIYRAVAKPWFSFRPSPRFPPVSDCIRAGVEGDCAIIRHKGQTIALTSPLHAQGKTSTRVGEIAHNVLIGKQPRDVVVSSKDNQLRVHLPSLEEYTALTPRLVTPIYAPDANLIVSLLDLHPQESEYAPESVPGIEILEAGTGHGALTLHLARAIHAANAGRHVSGVYSGHPGNKAGISRGRALIHTIDVSPKYSEHAAKIVRGFRQGLYMRDIEFHIGDVSEWIDRQKSIRDMRNLLSHALLDLPSSHSYVEKVASALRVDGKLVVFNPSITQINSAIQLVKTKRLPLQLERVVEVGHAMTGGRIWDVRFVKPRILTKRLNVKQTAAAVGDSERAVGTGEDLDARAVDDDDSVMDEEGYEMVCRPKVGGRTSGGGFVALWSKNRTREDGQRPEAC